MLKKKIQFQDLDGNTVEEEFYFNISKAELAERELSLIGGWQKHMQHILDNVKTNPAALIAEMKWLVKTSYGVRSVDGRKFYKSEEIYNDFAATDAYSELFYALCTNAETSADFVNGVLGETVNKLSKEIDARGGAKELTLPKENVKSNDEMTQKHPRKMTPEELKAAFAAKLRPADKRPLWLLEGRAPTDQEFSSMSYEELHEYGADLQKYL